MDAAFYAEYAAAEDRHWWFVARRQILRHVLHGLALPSGAAILEAGCGTGGNLAMLAEVGKLHAFELDDGARTFAQARGVVDVEAGALPSAVPFGDARFDLVAMLDVLEHIPDDQGALHTIRERLQPGGRLLLTVPAFPFLWSHHDEINHHERRYTRGPLVSLLRETGFRVRHATYFNTFLFPAVVAARTAGKLTGKEGSDLAMPRPEINDLLRRIFASERRFLPTPGFPFGVSLLAVAERQAV